MGKLLGLYHDCKNKDDTKYYLFKSGLFYYFKIIINTFILAHQKLPLSIPSKKQKPH